MSVACYLEPTKPRAAHWMEAFAVGCGGRLVLNGKRDRSATDHAVMGNWPVAEKLIADFARDGTKFWYLDTAYIQDIDQRCIRIERGRFWPPSGKKHSITRARLMGVELSQWKYAGTHVLICLQAMKFGRPWGIDIAQWQSTIEAKVKAVTDRPVIMRRKPVSDQAKRDNPLAPQLEDAWCVVTHSSTVAVTAALEGVPVFCEPTCAAAEVGCTHFELIESPLRPERKEWIAALAWRQWSAQELRSGEAWTYLRAEQ